jgi:hypothetical protein
MATWNHRVIVYPCGMMGIHEVHYNKQGDPTGYTVDTVGVVGEDKEELLWTIQRMREACSKSWLKQEELDIEIDQGSES